MREAGHTAPLLFRQGFRPFFLGAGLWSALAVAIWAGVLAAGWSPPSVFDPVAWHAREMLFGYAGAKEKGTESLPEK